MLAASNQRVPVPPDDTAMVLVVSPLAERCRAGAASWADGVGGEEQSVPLAAGRVHGLAEGRAQA